MCHCCFKFIAFLLLGIVVQGRLCIVHSTGAPIDVHCLECTLLYLRRHKLPAPHLALWPTEVHVVVRRKVCEKGCYFGGIYPPPVAIGKMKVCM